MDILLIIIAVFFGVPVLAYLVMKFGVAGYLRARQRHDQKAEPKQE